MTSIASRLFARIAAPNAMRQFGESLTYFDDGGDSGREVLGKVERNVETYNGTDMPTYAIVVTLWDHPLKGRAASDVNDNADAILLAMIEGGTPERRQVTKLLNASNGTVQLQVR